MKSKTRILALVSVGALAATALGTGLALAVDGAPDGDVGQQRALNLESAPTTRLDTGTTPGGSSFELSQVRPSFDTTGHRCLEVEIDPLKASGCLAVPAKDDAVQASQMMLGEDLFILALVRDDVQGLEIAKTDGGEAGSTARVVNLDEARLMYAVLDAPHESLPTTEIGGERVPVPPTVRLRAIGADGQLVETRDLSALSPEG